MQNDLGVSRTLPTTVSAFYDRPFPVIHGEVFARALAAQITDTVVRHLATQRLIGNINQWSDSTDIQGIAREKIRQIYT